MQTGKQSIKLSDGTAANYYFDEEGIMKTGKQTIYDEDLGRPRTGSSTQKAVKRTGLPWHQR